MHKPLLAAVLFLLASLASAEDDNVVAAKQLFERFVALEQAHDSAIADLYAEEALITSRRPYPMGEPRDTLIPGQSYKTQLRDLMAITKTRGDQNRYTNVSYTPEGKFVRISASRFSVFKQRTSPLVQLVGPSSSGKWLIYDELSEPSD